MTPQEVSIRSIQHVTHDVLQIVLEKPAGISFNPGQAADISIRKKGWENEKRPFTFTCIPQNDYLEFTIKTYPDRKGVTNELLSLTPGDALILHDVFGDINYQGEGLFIAGGAGITPFISIFRQLQAKNEVGNNKLIFANKTSADIILEQEFKTLLGENFINILSDEKKEGYVNGFISEDFIQQHRGGLNKFYLCGPPPMMDAVEKHLSHLQVDESSIIKEAF